MGDLVAIHYMLHIHTTQMCKGHQNEMSLSLWLAHVKVASLSHQATFLHCHSPHFTAHFSFLHPPAPPGFSAAGINLALLCLRRSPLWLSGSLLKPCEEWKKLKLGSFLP